MALSAPVRRKGFARARAGGRTAAIGEKTDSMAVSRVFSALNRPVCALRIRPSVMKILHHRATRRFIALLVQCRCGKKFLHRLNRPVIACLQCGRTDDLGRIIEKLSTAREAERRRAPKAARRSRIRAA
jgi:hypothetical protein